MNFKKEIVVPTVILLLFDSIYLYANQKIFANKVLEIQKTTMQVRYSSVIACYALLVIGLWYFIIRQHKEPIAAFYLGILIYGVYETTTFATFKNWNLGLVLMDTIWGGVLLFLTTSLTYKVNSGHIFN